MVLPLLLCVGTTLLAAQGPEPSTPSPAADPAYQAARAAAGRDAGAHTRLALWCEAHGLDAERAEHLALAVLADPGNALARALMGLVREGDRWVRPESLQEELRDDPATAPARAEYQARRAKLDPGDADAHWELGLWCDQAGLDAEARAHFAVVTRLDPKRDAAWTRLGARQVDGRWLTPEQAAAEKLEKQAQQKADRVHRAQLEKWRGQLRDPRKRAAAEAGLAGLHDPRAVPSIVAVFARGGASDQSNAVQLLGQISVPESSLALAGLAVRGASDEVRRRATEVLRTRDPREFAAPLIRRLGRPVAFEVRPVNGPGQPGVLFVEGKQFNLRRQYSPPAGPVLQPGDRLAGTDEFGLPVIARPYGYVDRTFTAAELLTGYQGGTPNPPNGAADPEGRNRFVGQAAGGSAEVQQGAAALADAVANSAGGLSFEQWVAATSLQARPGGAGSAFQFRYRRDLLVPVGQQELEARRAALSAQEQLEADVAVIKQYNAGVQAVNDRILGVLEPATGLDYGADRDRWLAWYFDQLGYTYRAASESDRPTLFEEAALSDLPRPVPVGVYTSPVELLARYSCFAAGTPVHTRTGLVPIERLRPGDLVLSQDPRTGGLSYQPVLTVHHNPPGDTLALTVGDETVVASTYHRFWEAGRGWAMARELTLGRTLRALKGTGTVAEILPGGRQPVFNLDVAGGHTFFVGRRGLLVHDNGLPASRSEPFDRPADLAAAAPVTPTAR